ARMNELRAAERAAELSGPPLDLTMPARAPAPRGHRHPVTQVKEEILDIFRSLGFSVAWGPQVELEVNNFTKLAFPPDHPATDMQDSFWGQVAGAPPHARVRLRTAPSHAPVGEVGTHAWPLAPVPRGTADRRAH